MVFEEKNTLPDGYSKEEYESKGFFNKRVQDFPLRGKAVFLKVRRRRWRHKETGEELTRDFTFLAAQGIIAKQKFEKHSTEHSLEL